jgi:hypothetical protein
MVSSCFATSSFFSRTLNSCFSAIVGPFPALGPAVISRHLIDFGLSLSARRRDKARTPSPYSALTPSGFISIGMVTARSNRPASRSRRCSAAFSG